MSLHKENLAVRAGFAARWIARLNAEYWRFLSDRSISEGLAMLVIFCFSSSVKAIFLAVLPAFTLLEAVVEVPDSGVASGSGN